MALSLLHEALLRYFTNNNESSISLTNAPLPPSEFESLNNPILLSGFITITTASFIPSVIAFWSSCYILAPIQECVSRAKLLQLMTGISAFTYWLTTFFWDMVIHTFITLILLIPLGIFAGYVFIAHSDASGTFVLLCLLFGWSTLPICYLFSRVVKKPATGFTLVLSFTVLTGVILAEVCSVLEGMYSAESNEMMKLQGAMFALRLLPSFATTWGFVKLFNTSYVNTFCDTIPQDLLNVQCKRGDSSSSVFKCCKDICGDDCFQRTYPITWEQYGCGRDLLFLFIDGALYFTLLLVLETGIFDKLFSYIWAKIPWTKTGAAALKIQTGFNAERDSDVIQEEERISSIDNASMRDEALIVKELTKWYAGFCAVDKVSFGVHKEECFGLLGVNGAGKTSSFKMLTGDIFPTSGDAWIQSTSVQANLKKFQSFIGYCPQFDALIDRLTGKETLYLFGRLRGIPPKELHRHVNHMINSVDLNECADRETRFYSGGNKRKLSLAMSIIGTPPIILLDEPTSGVDPVSRRKIWKVLEDTRKEIKSAVILCTHSMEECEALCGRLAIMVNGQFRCLGTIHHLKNKYGLGYTVIIKLRREQCDDTQIKSSILSHFQSTFTNSSLKDEHQGMFHFHVTDTAVPWSYLFKSVEHMKQLFNFEDYLISGTTLEQIFLMFARSQREST